MATSAEAGIVNNHAHTMRPATPHLTPDKLVVEPTPTIEPVMVWVVDTGMPRCVARNSVIAPAVSAQKPPTGLSFVSFMPIVRTMRQPPSAVPRPMAALHDSTIHAVLELNSDSFVPAGRMPPANST